MHIVNMSQQEWQRKYPEEQERLGLETQLPVEKVNLINELRRNTNRCVRNAEEHGELSIRLVDVIESVKVEKLASTFSAQLTVNVFQLEANDGSD